MLNNDEINGIREYPSNADILRTIRYLDPDLRAEKAEKDTSAVMAIGATLLTALTDALTCIGLYVRSF